MVMEKSKGSPLFLLSLTLTVGFASTMAHGGADTKLFLTAQIVKGGSLECCLPLNYIVRTFPEFIIDIRVRYTGKPLNSWQSY